MLSRASLSSFTLCQLLSPHGSFAVMSASETTTSTAMHSHSGPATQTNSNGLTSDEMQSPPKALLSQSSSHSSQPSHGEPNSEVHQHALTDAVKKVTTRAKRTMYLHHRHQRGLSKQFTPGSASIHLPWTHRQKTSQAAEPDVESQTETDINEGQSLLFGQNVAIMFTTFPYW